MIVGNLRTECLQWTGSRQTSSKVGSSPGVSALYGNYGDYTGEKNDNENNKLFNDIKNLHVSGTPLSEILGTSCVELTVVLPSKEA